MGINEPLYFKCMLCGSSFLSAKQADQCCGRAKALLFYNAVREDFALKQAKQFAEIKSKILIKASHLTGGFW